MRPHVVVAVTAGQLPGLGGKIKLGYKNSPTGYDGYLSPKYDDYLSPNMQAVTHGFFLSL